jgi:hypothetical protein
VRVDEAAGAVRKGRVSFEAHDGERVSSVAFDLTPSNIPIPTAADPFLTTNFDRTIRPCYDLGEYLGTTVADDRPVAAWGDNRNPWTSPPDSPAAGVHAQPDVFFKRLKK